MPLVEDLEVDGRRVAFRRVGNGPPLVMLHGAVSDSQVWRASMDELKDEFTVIAWDAPGCGQSSDPDSTWRLPEYADCLAGLLAALDCGPVHLLGHSWGSALALQLYERNPRLAASLILLGGYAGWAGSLPPEEVAARLRFAEEVAERLPDAFEPTSMRGLFSEMMPADAAEELSTIMSQARATGTLVMAYALAEADLRAMLGQIEVPVLVLTGDRDERSPLPVARALHTAIPTSTLVVMEGLGHENYLESRETFVRELRRFLHSLPNR